ncbi:Ribokinase [Macrophomina phaseolina MS6]|uniref:Ribokinase n=1 Tax=Macrophomina phaseolina (strain MS6) TaxID=1126212 RepID=K2R8U9_MACPH|nr:Ribokinase [Macrophomina phaseolina MS6]
MTSSSPPTIPTIAVLGSLNVDLVTRTPRVPAAGETIIANGFSTGHGGKGANQAVACARLSRTRTRPSSTPPDVFVRMIGAVGDDHFGAEFLRALKDDGLDVEGVRVVAGERTGTAVIVVEEESGENRIMVVINPAPAVPLSDEVYQGLGHLIVNESEAALLSGRPAEEITPDADLTAVAADFVRRGVRNVIITLGSAGCFYHTSALHAEGLPGKIVPARKVKVVDTTAAGDTFAGAYAVAVAKSRAQGPFDIDAAIAFANRAAAQTVQRKGAQSAIPWLDEVPEA